MKTINVLVKPRSTKGQHVEYVDGTYVVYVREPAIEGRANVAVQKVLAQHFVVPRNRVVLKNGQKSHHKIYSIEA